MDDEPGRRECYLFPEDRFKIQGIQAWAREVDFQVGYHETTREIAVNEVGNVYLTGYSSSDGDILMKLIDPSQWRFIRGDADGDGRIDPIPDAVTILLAGLFGIGPIPCRAALDANGDGVAAEPVDAIVLLTWAFLGGPAPAAPFPECGPGHLAGDPGLGCEEVAGPCR